MSNIASIVELTFAIVALWLLFWEWREFRVDELRQRLFRARDRLFRKAAAGVLPFDSKAYAITRANINGMIRFAHEVSMVRLHMSRRVVSRFIPEAPKRFRAELVKASSSLPSDDARRAIVEAHQLMDFYMIRHLVLTSPPLFVLFCVKVLKAMVKHQTANFRTAFSKTLRSPQDRNIEVATLESEVHKMDDLLACH